MGVGGAITAFRRATSRFGCAIRIGSRYRTSVLSCRPAPRSPSRGPPAYAELHCHSHFSFLDGASAPDDLVARAVELGLAGLAVTDHQGLYGAVRFSTAAEAAGLHPVIGVEIELVDAAVAGPGRARGAGPAPLATGPAGALRSSPSRRIVGRGPARPAAPGARPAARAIGAVVKEDHRGIGEGQRGPHLVLLARDATGWRSLCRMVSRANLAGSKAVPRFTQALLAEHAEGLIALSGCREGELARRLRAGDREGARAVAERYAALFGAGRLGGREPASSSSSSTTSSPTTTGSSSETARLAAELGLPVVVTNDVHYALPEGRELQDVLTAIRHGRSLRELARPAPAGRGVVPQGGRGAARAAAGRAGDRGAPTPCSRGRGARGSPRRRRSPPAAGWSSRSSATASRASPCPRARRRSATSRSCAGRGRGAATTR